LLTIEGIVNLDGFLNEHGPALLLFARNRTYSVAEAEDILQTAIVNLWKNGNFDENNKIPMGLVYTAIRNTAIDVYRSRKRRRLREEKAGRDLYTDHENGIFSAADGKRSERMDAAAKALEKLSPKLREVVIMKIFGEMKFREIGEVLSISPNTAATRYRYGMKRLRKLMGTQ
jgi:RNA polymerase sigma-70 factor (ECF subfamily)